jgi:hypothetical protein
MNGRGGEVLKRQRLGRGRGLDAGCPVLDVGISQPFGLLRYKKWSVVDVTIIGLGRSRTVWESGLRNWWLGGRRMAGWRVSMRDFG